jgi:hypothetical protein
MEVKTDIALLSNLTKSGRANQKRPSVSKNGKASQPYRQLCGLL